MKKLIGTSLLVLLPFVAVPPARANYKVDIGANPQFNISSNGNQCGYGTEGRAAPWYLYWPLEAHFMMGAPTGYPFWPSPMTAGPGFAMYQQRMMGPMMPPMMAPPMPLPMAPPQALPRNSSGVQPVYYVPQQAPSYWYGR